MEKSFFVNDSYYTSKEITVLGNTYSVTIVTGKYNYVQIRKVSNNPFGSSGKQFDNFDHAQEHYKCPEMKVQLLLIELKLI